MCTIAGDPRVAEELERWDSLNTPSFRIEMRPLLANRFATMDLEHVPPRLRKHYRLLEIQVLTASQAKADVAALLLYAAHALIDGCIPMGIFLG